MILVPFGAACRPTFQVRTYLQSKGIVTPSYPFDWTITPYTTLKFILSKDFCVSRILVQENLSPCIGSLVDTYTGLIHYHDFLPGTFTEPHKDNMEQLISTAKGRFEHTLHNLYDLRNYKDTRLGFIRWMRRGVPDKQLPELFTGESPEYLFDLISKFLGRDDFALLSVTTWTVGSDLCEDDILNKYEHDGVIFSSTIKERKGFNGDMTDNYKGDTRSWTVLLDKFVHDANLGTCPSPVSLID